MIENCYGCEHTLHMEGASGGYCLIPFLMTNRSSTLLRFANGDEAALMKKLSDSHSSSLAGSLLIAPQCEDVDKTYVAKRSFCFMRWGAKTTKYTFAKRSFCFILETELQVFIFAKLPFGIDKRISAPRLRQPVIKVIHVRLKVFHNTNDRTAVTRYERGNASGIYNLT